MQSLKDSMQVIFLISHMPMMYIFSEGIGPRTSSRGTSSVDSAATSNAVGSGKATLRLRSKGPPLVETEEVSYHLRLLFIFDVALTYLFYFKILART